MQMDRSGSEPERRAPPAPGVYKFIVRECDEREHKDGTSVLSLRCESIGVAKHRLFERLYFTEKAKWYSNQKLKGLGVPDDLAQVMPWMLIDTRFEAACVVEKSKPNAQGKVYDNLKIDIAPRDGFFCGVRLIERGPNMPASGADVQPEPSDPFADSGAADSTPF